MNLHWRTGCLQCCQGPSPALARPLLHAGTIMGAAAQFNVTVTGKGGHAAMPHTTVDPVVAGAAIVTALQV